MVKYKAMVARVEPIYGETGHPIEAWVVFEINGMAIETFHTGTPIAPEEGKEYGVDIDIMTYDLYKVNIEEKMLKQISTFPKDPLYFLMGEVVDLKEREREHKGKKVKSIWLRIDCGIEIETHTAYYKAAEVGKGDYVAIIGKMFAEVVKE